MNIAKCSECGRSLISEEIEDHECRKVMDYRIKDGILWLFDGKEWYPRKLSQPKGNTEKINRRGNRTRFRHLILI